MEKSHVSMEQKVCIVCGQLYDSGSILLDRRLKQSMDRYTITGFGMCEEHKKLTDEGYIHLVGADPTRSELREDGNMDPDGAYRTGDVIHIKAHVFEQIFNMPAPKGGVCFVDPQVISALKEYK